MLRREVCDNAESAIPGRVRMLAICKARAIYIDLFLVGPFITATSFEFDGRAGRVHDLIFAAAATWLKTLAREACTAIEPGELPARRDPTQITFELNPISIGAKLVSCTVIPAAPGAACIHDPHPQFSPSSERSSVSRRALLTPPDRALADVRLDPDRLGNHLDRLYRAACGLCG